MKIKEILFWRFSLFGGLLALVSVLVLSYFYYRLHSNSPFIYSQIISNIYEYRVLDSRIYLAGSPEQFNFALAKDNLKIQQSLINSTIELFNNLSVNEIKVPDINDFYEIESSITQRIRWLAICQKNYSCNIDEWNEARSKAQVACETLQGLFNNLQLGQANVMSKNLRIFYILSVMLLLSTLFFAAKRGK
jgi:hypothetical protein